VNLPINSPDARSAFQALNTVVRPAIRAGLGNPLPVGGGAVVLETIGRKSGLARQVPVLAVRRGNRVSVSTARSDSQWLANIEAEPSVGLWISGRRRDGRARVTRGCLNVVDIDLTDEPNDMPAQHGATADLFTSPSAA